jgi:uncharacterized protein with HXXEE motif
MRLPQLFLIAIVLLQLHMVEQLLFGYDELYELQAMVGTAVTWFPDADQAAVVLVFAVVTAVLFLSYGFMSGGVPRLIAASFFGVEFMVEGHHIVKTIVRGAYFPGAVTAIAFVALGALILASARREFRHASPRLEDPRLRLSNV